jgi:transcription initiation factor IIF auxiliary subunit
MAFEIQQSVSPHHEGWWDWAVWLKGPSDELDDVKYVEYILHPTFPNPMKKVKDRDSNFRLQARGWGEFMIAIRIHLKDDDDIIKMEHWLELDEDAPAKVGESLIDTPSFRGRSSEKPRIFISSAMTDMKFTYALKDALEDEGVEVLMGQDLDDDRPLSWRLHSERRSIQAGLFVVSEIINPSLKRDFNAVQENKISSLVVELGEERNLPDYMRDVQRFQIKDASETEQVAASIARRVRSQF